MPLRKHLTWLCLPLAAYRHIRSARYCVKFCCIACCHSAHESFDKQDGRLLCQFLQAGVPSASTGAHNDVQPSTSAQGNLEDPFWFMYQQHALLPPAASLHPHRALFHRREVCLVLYSSCACRLMTCLSIVDTTVTLVHFEQSTCPDMPSCKAVPHLTTCMHAS